MKCVILNFEFVPLCYYPPRNVCMCICGHAFNFVILCYAIPFWVSFA